MKHKKIKNNSTYHLQKAVECWELKWCAHLNPSGQSLLDLENKHILQNKMTFCWYNGLITAVTLSPASGAAIYIINLLRAAQSIWKKL